MKREELGPYLVSAPLYQVAELENDSFRNYPASAQPTYRDLMLPGVVRRHCQTCDGNEIGPSKAAATSRRLARGASRSGRIAVRTATRKCCRSGSSGTRTRGKDFIFKAGQYPKLEITIPKAFDEALGDRKSLYLKAMTLRHNNYGIGAVVYLRRVIEETTDDMLDLLEEHMVAAGSPEADIEALRAVKKSTQFEDKVAEAAKVIPAHFRPGGVNPFADLCKLVSIGLHNKSDAECCAIVDGMDRAFKFIYTRWKSYLDETKEYNAAAKAMREAVDKKTKGN